MWIKVITDNNIQIIWHPSECYSITASHCFFYVSSYQLSSTCFCVTWIFPGVFNKISLFVMEIGALLFLHHCHHIGNNAQITDQQNARVSIQFSLLIQLIMLFTHMDPQNALICNQKIHDMLEVLVYYLLNEHNLLSPSQVLNIFK